MRPIRNPAKPPLRQRAPRLPGPGRALPRAARSRAIAGPADAHARPRSAPLPGPGPRGTPRREPRAHSAPPHPQVRSGPGRARRKARDAADSRATWMLSAWRGAACTCAPLFRRGRGRAWDPLKCGPTVWAAWAYMGRGQRWSRTRLPQSPPAFAPGACSLAVGGNSLSEATFARTQTTPSPPKPSAPPRPPPRGLRRPGDPMPPAFARAGHRRPPRVSQPRSLPGPPHSGLSPRTPPAHSQVAAAGQQEEDLRAVHGEQRAARRQQPHGGPALPAGWAGPAGRAPGPAEAGVSRALPEEGRRALGTLACGSRRSGRRCPAARAAHRPGAGARGGGGAGRGHRGASAAETGPPSVDRSEPALSLALPHVSKSPRHAAAIGRAAPTSASSAGGCFKGEADPSARREPPPGLAQTALAGTPSPQLGRATGLWLRRRVHLGGRAAG